MREGGGGISDKMWESMRHRKYKGKRERERERMREREREREGGREGGRERETASVSWSR